MNEDKLKLLCPFFADRIRRLIPTVLADQAVQGLDLDIFSGLRTWQEQDDLYAIGRTKEMERGTVTNARGGQSAHNYGLGCDIVFKVAGKWSWDTELPWGLIGEAGRNLGLTWGGSWGDMPHLQLTGGLKLDALARIYLGNKQDLNYVWATVADEIMKKEIKKP